MTDEIKKLQDELASIRATVDLNKRMLEATFLTGRENVALLDVIILYLKHHPDLWDPDKWHMISQKVADGRKQQIQTLYKQAENLLLELGLELDSDGNVIKAKADKTTPAVYFDVNIEA